MPGRAKLPVQELWGGNWQRTIRSWWICRGRICPSDASTALADRGGAVAASPQAVVGERARVWRPRGARAHEDTASAFEWLRAPFGALSPSSGLSCSGPSRRLPAPRLPLLRVALPSFRSRLAPFRLRPSSRQAKCIVDLACAVREQLGRRRTVGALIRGLVLLLACFFLFSLMLCALAVAFLGGVLRWGGGHLAARDGGTAGWQRRAYGGERAVCGLMTKVQNLAQFVQHLVKLTNSGQSRLECNSCAPQRGQHTWCEPCVMHDLPCAALVPHGRCC